MSLIDERACSVCVCVFLCVCVRACVCVCDCVCIRVKGEPFVSVSVVLLLRLWLCDLCAYSQGSSMCVYYVTCVLIHRDRAAGGGAPSHARERLAGGDRGRLRWLCISILVRGVLCIYLSI